MKEYEYLAIGDITIEGDQYFAYHLRDNQSIYDWGIDNEGHTGGWVRWENIGHKVDRSDWWRRPVVKVVDFKPKSGLGILIPLALGFLLGKRS